MNSITPQKTSSSLVALAKDDWLISVSTLERNLEPCTKRYEWPKKMLSFLSRSRGIFTAIIGKCDEGEQLAMQRHQLIIMIREKVPQNFIPFMIEEHGTKREAKRKSLDA